ncbi:MAG TPA: hypothetical protein VFU59_08900 [Candidatus Eisenbacteria bacterium]|nr:hypothetical protein [Candidatus Eisenbacteria bacterium]
MSAERPPMNRRRFIHVLAASGAAVIATGLPGAKAAPPPKAAARRPAKPLPPAMNRELQNQEKSVADMLKVIRAYELPPGSDPAFTFRAMRARRGGRR